jgi:hypothetical protein
MGLESFRSALMLASVVVLPIALSAQVTFKGVVSDSVNGMLIEGVTVSAGGASTVTDAKGAFTLVTSGTSIKGPIKSGSAIELNGGEEAITLRDLKGSSVDQSHFAAGRYVAEGAGHGRVPVLRKSGAAQAQVLTFTKDNFNTLALSVPAGGEATVDAKMKSPYPLKNILKLFLDPTIPANGPSESKPQADCNGSAEPNPNLIGGQLNRHDFVMVGEDSRRINIVIGGKVVWKYDTEDSWEDDEVWVLSNGNILHAHMTYIEMISPKKEVIWHLNRPGNAEFHTCQPIGVDKVLFLQNEDAGALVRLYNIKTKTFEMEHRLPEIGGGPHGQCRRLRMTPQGTYVFGIMSQGAISEYDKDWKLIKKLNAGSLWGAVPLKNGNFLLQREGGVTSVEMTRNGDIAWSVSIPEIQPQLDILAPGSTKITSPQTCERLSNGNTVISGTRFCQPNIPQAIEVTPDKKVVWILKDPKNLGASVSMQFLDEPGYPEVPGETNH